MSNFPAGMLRARSSIVPLLADQVEYHPFLEQDRAARLVAEHDLTLTAYSPLAHGKVAGHPELTAIGEAARQDAPARSRCAGCSTSRTSRRCPKASSHERRVENFDVFDFELTDADRERIAALPKDVRTADPGWAPDWDATT